MSISTFSKFYYGFDVNENNYLLDFTDTGGVNLATVQIGSFTLTNGLTQVADAMNDAGDQAYSVTMDRSTRLVTISAPGVFSLEVGSGPSSGASIFSTIGFTGSDRSGSNSYTGNLPVGTSYEPPFILQDYIVPEHFQDSIDPTVKTSADGTVEVVRFGTENFLQASIDWVTNLPMDGKLIKSSPTNVEQLVSLMDFLTTKSPFEFIPDESDPNTFINLLLEKTPDSTNGTGFKLKELIGRNLPGFYQTGILLFRVVV